MPRTCCTALYRTRHDLSCEHCTTAGMAVEATSSRERTLASAPAASTAVGKARAGAAKHSWRTPRNCRVTTACRCGLAGRHPRQPALQAARLVGCLTHVHAGPLACNQPHAVLVIPREIHKRRQNIFTDVLRLQSLRKGCQRLQWHLRCGISRCLWCSTSGGAALRWNGATAPC